MKYIYRSLSAVTLNLITNLITLGLNVLLLPFYIIDSIEISLLATSGCPLGLIGIGQRRPILFLLHAEILRSDLCLLVFVWPILVISLLRFLHVLVMHKPRPIFIILIISLTFMELLKLFKISALGLYTRLPRFVFTAILSDCTSFFFQ